MEQYISKSALVAEIERMKNYYENIQMIKPVYGSNIEDFNELLSFLDTLEVKEVDLEKEIERVFDDDFFKDPVFGKLVNRNAGISIAKHFFELGLKAKDWKKERMEECSFRKVGCTMYKDKILECNGACSWVVDYPKWKQLKAQKGE